MQGDESETDSNSLHQQAPHLPTDIALQKAPPRSGTVGASAESATVGLHAPYMDMNATHSTGAMPDDGGSPDLSPTRSMIPVPNSDLLMSVTASQLLPSEILLDESIIQDPSCGRDGVQHQNRSVSTMQSWHKVLLLQPPW